MNEGDNVILKNLRLSIDANGQNYFTTTFKSEWTSENFFLVTSLYIEYMCSLCRFDDSI